MNNKFWLLGIHRNIIADGKITDEQYDLIEAVAPSGSKTPPHIHNEYVETEFVLEGELTIHTDTETVVLRPGDGYTIPKGKPHRLSATGEVLTRTMTVFSPGGFAQVIRRAGISGESHLAPAQKTDMALFNKLSSEIGDVTLDSLISESTHQFQG